ncbi:MAG: CopG family antitoxin [Rhodospirillaceae bacterium]|nr:CopG family antitoxin [Rhodospirillaceae bacterium]
MKAREFEKMFDAGKDVGGLVDWSKARRPNLAPKRVNVDFPAWMVESLDREAKRLGVTRQSLIKLWLADKLEQGSKAA